MTTAATQPGGVQSAAPQCDYCGGSVVFVPGYECTQCQNCGQNQALPRPFGKVPAHDFVERLEELAVQPESIELVATHCDSCGASVEQLDEINDHNCPFCGANIGLASSWKRTIKPHGVVPFEISQVRALHKFHEWLDEQWFAPESLRKGGRCDSLQGVYIPYWSFDAEAACTFEAERGVNFTVTKGKGDNAQKVNSTEWKPVRGMFVSSYDDVRVRAGSRLPDDLLEELGPATGRAVPFDAAYLAGIPCQSYELGLQEGFQKATQQIREQASRTVAAKIGGDEQRIHALRPSLSNVRFRLLLIPIWIGTFRHKQKTYQFAINGVSGKIHGKYPESMIKAAFVGCGLLAAAVAALWLLIKACASSS